MVNHFLLFLSNYCTIYLVLSYLPKQIYKNTLYQQLILVKQQIGLAQKPHSLLK